MHSNGHDTSDYIQQTVFKKKYVPERCCKQEFSASPFAILDFNTRGAPQFDRDTAGQTLIQKPQGVLEWRVQRILLRHQLWQVLFDIHLTECVRSSKKSLWAKTKRQISFCPKANQTRTSHERENPKDSINSRWASTTKPRVCVRL